MGGGIDKGCISGEEVRAGGTAQAGADFFRSLNLEIISLRVHKKYLITCIVPAREVRLEDQHRVIK